MASLSDLPDSNSNASLVDADDTEVLIFGDTREDSNDDQYSKDDLDEDYEDYENYEDYEDYDDEDDEDGTLRLAAGKGVTFAHIKEGFSGRKACGVTQIKLQMT